MRCCDPAHTHGFSVTINDVSQPVGAFAPIRLDIAFCDQFLESRVGYVQNPRTIVSADEH